MVGLSPTIPKVLCEEKVLTVERLVLSTVCLACSWPLLYNGSSIIRVWLAGISQIVTNVHKRLFVSVCARSVVDLAS